MVLGYLITEREADDKTISIIGGGQMGSRISLACAMGGFKVRVYDKNPDFKQSTP